MIRRSEDLGDADRHALREAGRHLGALLHVVAEGPQHLETILRIALKARLAKELHEVLLVRHVTVRVQS